MKHTPLKWEWDAGRDNRLVFTADGTHVATFPHRKAINMGIEKADEGNKITTTAMLHLIKTFNASNGMPTEKAVEYLEHGAVWDLMIENIITAINDNSLTAHDALIKISTILAGLEG